MRLVQRRCTRISTVNVHWRVDNGPVNASVGWTFPGRDDRTKLELIWIVRVVEHGARVGDPPGPDGMRRAKEIVDVRRYALRRRTRLVDSGTKRTASGDAVMNSPVRLATRIQGQDAAAAYCAARTAPKSSLRGSRSPIPLVVFRSVIMNRGVCNFSF